MSRFMDRMKLIKDATNKAYIVEDIAFMVMEDLKDASFECELIKHKVSKPLTWRIHPKNELSPEEQKRFDEIKEKSTDEWRTDYKIRLKNLKRDILRV